MHLWTSSIGERSYACLVGGIPTPLKNHGVRQLGYDIRKTWKVIQNSMVPVTTNQINFIYDPNMYRIYLPTFTLWLFNIAMENHHF